MMDFGFDYRGPGPGPGALMRMQQPPPLAFDRAGPAVTPAYRNPPGVRRYKMQIYRLFYLCDLFMLIEWTFNNDPNWL